MSDNTTTVQFNVVREGVTKIEDCASKMDGIFNDFDNSMTKSLSPDVFAGIAAEAVGTDYATLKSQYADFIALIKQFAEEYRKAANIMERHENVLDKQSQTLNQDLQRM